MERLLIETPKPYSRIVAAVKALGGTVTYEFKKVDGIAVEVPSNSVQSLRALVGQDAVLKDMDVPAPQAADAGMGKTLGRPTKRVQTSRSRSNATVPGNLKGFARDNPDTYELNNLGTNIDKLHAKGYTGAGVIVAVIDSGVRPGYPSLDKDKSIIGGISFVTEDDNGFSDRRNDPHGTFIAGMISANAIMDISGSPLLGAIQMYAPKALFNGTFLPLIGTAPSASIYVVRVFGEAGAPESRIIAAIEHVIQLKEWYDKGDRRGLNIQVCNLSFGDATVAVGLDLLDREIDALLDAGIVPVVAVGNTGPSSLTGSSPGSSYSALTVGAASPAANERIFQEFYYADIDGPGIGMAFRPFNSTQTASFSSRGPHADGRIDPEVMANGVANFGQGYDDKNDVSIAGGTSFSTPIVSGVAASLIQAFPRATALQIRNAIAASGDSEIIDDGSTVLDEGGGMVDAWAAYNLLDQGNVPNRLPQPRPTESVVDNIERGTNLEVRRGSFIRAVRNLKPGQRADFFYHVPPNTRSVRIRLTDVTPHGPEQNILFGDDIYLAVHTAKTSSIGTIGDYRINQFTLGGEFSVDEPEPGVMRITVIGDWTNAGRISANLSVSSIPAEPFRDLLTEGRIEDKQKIRFLVQVPPGTTSATFRLRWEKNWSHYPAADLDLHITDPDGVVHLQAAQLNNPEFASFSNPKPGTWELVVDAFSIQAFPRSQRPASDRFQLYLTLTPKIVP
jgi:subtilisin family serine protease